MQFIHICSTILAPLLKPLQNTYSRILIDSETTVNRLDSMTHTLWVIFYISQGFCRKIYVYTYFEPSNSSQKVRKLANKTTFRSIHFKIWNIPTWPCIWRRKIDSISTLKLEKKNGRRKLLSQKGSETWVESS